MGLENVRHVILVLSGKGGVGKSSVTLQLALALCQQGHNVGILDIDLTGPSIPRLLGLEGKKVRQAPGGWLPVEVHSAADISESENKRDNAASEATAAAAAATAATNGHIADASALSNGTIPHPPPAAAAAAAIPSSSQSILSPHISSKRGSLHALSLAFLLPSRTSAVIWRGPKKTAMIRQFLSDALWPPGTDYLLVDTPPGTSDEHIAVVEELHKLREAASSSTPLAGHNNNNNNNNNHPLSGAVVVTTPQAISTSDVRKELNFCVKTGVPVLGVVENMAGFVCPCCGEVSNVFSKGGGEIMARECAVPFLGSVPVDTGFGALVDGVKVQYSAAQTNFFPQDATRQGNAATSGDADAVADADDHDDDGGGGGSSNSSSIKDERPLIDRYKDVAALNAIFTRFATRIVNVLDHHHHQPHHQER